MIVRFLNDGRKGINKGKVGDAERSCRNHLKRSSHGCDCQNHGLSLCRLGMIKLEASGFAFSASATTDVVTDTSDAMMEAFVFREQKKERS
jgi:hypothetical protein